MSKQWGHGFHAGYQKAIGDAQIAEIFEKYPDAHWVPIAMPQSEEIIPLDPMLCRYEPSQGITCESRSGSCGGASYLFRNDYMVCTEPYRAKQKEFHPNTDH